MPFDVLSYGNNRCLVCIIIPDYAWNGDSLSEFKVCALFSMTGCRICMLSSWNITCKMRFSKPLTNISISHPVTNRFH